MKNRIYIVLTVLAMFFQNMRADEGIWIPMLIEKYNIKLMQEKGFKLSAEDIYSVNKASMKDAVVSFGGFCTGEIISDNGLLITNFHCGRDYVQMHSSLEHDYLANGFWAMSKEEELPNEDLYVTILKRMEDVTDKVLSGVNDAMDEVERNKIISQNSKAVVASAIKGSHYQASVYQFYMGNQYFLFIEEKFTDIRLVGSPPVTIGDFGSETDNWIWPRHTGDFSLFRIYAGKDNNPSVYSQENIPYKPAYFFPVSLKGAREGDFTMVFGYPGITYEYVPSYHIEMIKDYLYPKKIEIRTKKIEIMEAGIEEDPLTRIQYYVKKAGIANAWKKWQGEILGLNRMNTVEKKKVFEKEFSEWVEKDPERIKKYGQILQSYSNEYNELRELRLVNEYTSEVFSDVESFRVAKSLSYLTELIKSNASEESVSEAKKAIKATAEGIFKDYNKDTDRKLFAAVLELYGSNIGDKWLPDSYKRLSKISKGDFSSTSSNIYSKSVFTDEARFFKFLDEYDESSIKKTERDWIYLLFTESRELLDDSLLYRLDEVNLNIKKLNRSYMAAQMEYDSSQVLYPDANSTLRIAYGNVTGYKAKDAVSYDYFTTMEGIMEKDDSKIYDYDVPEKLERLYEEKDYGRYSAENGKMPVCFIANNHTTGGNSGSPVINSEGQLIGINFDRAWEGVASDMEYNPDQSRNISLDIRYALFIIDKFAGAGYLIDEMKIIE
ncbi:MAG TPA: S46 family peptidase [Bacteroidales bacterium]|nr:S46 family peptidase [Bacteroidales bacterium]